MFHFSSKHARAALLSVALSLTSLLASGESAIMPAGPYKGQALDVSTKRPVTLLTAAESAAYGGPVSGVLFAANVSHGGHFYVARIPLAKIDSVIAQVEHFRPEWIAAHTMLRFHFEDAVELVAQDGDPSAPPATTHDLVFSPEYSAPTGVRFNLVSGVRDYAIVNRMVTLEDKSDDVVVRHHHRVNQIKLNFSAAERQRALITSLRISTEEGLHTMYNTITHSCVTQVFRVIDDAVSDRARWAEAGFVKKIWLILRYLPAKVVREVTTHMPVLMHGAACERLLLGPDSSLPDLDQELSTTL